MKKAIQAASNHHMLGFSGMLPAQCVVIDDRA
jgi:hypothetical protein